MTRKFGLMVALAGACLVMAACENDEKSASLTTDEQAVTAAETRADACCPAEKAAACALKKSECTKGAGDEVSAAETKASTSAPKSCCQSRKSADN